MEVLFKLLNFFELCTFQQIPMEGKYKMIIAYVKYQF